MLKDKIAVVTGSTSGIGLGIAEALAGEGANIVLSGIEAPDEVSDLIARLEQAHGVRIAYSNANLMTREGCEALIDVALETFGGVDILVNNAGIQHVSPITEFDPARWDAILSLNLSSNFHTIRRALPSMRERGYGRIVNIASAHGLRASPFKSAYVAAKHGVLGLTKVVALETAEEDITCNAICPGYVWTPLVEKQIADQAASHGISEEEVINEVLLAPQPKKRFAQVDEVGALTVFLCSAAAASITGAPISIDGGWTAR